jgi:type I restriction enzyme, S subunit
MKKLRFKDKNGEDFPKWSLVLFSSTYKKAKEGGTPSTTSSEYYENGSIPFAKIDDLKNKYINQLNTFITENGLKNSSAWIVPINSVLLSNGATIGETSINKIELATKQGILSIVPKIDTEFMFYLVSSESFRKKLKSITTKGTMDAAYIKDIECINVLLPTNNEQEKIGGFLSTFDKLIEKQQDKIDLLKELKKGYLQKMFPKNDANVPEIRFKGFTDAWEQYKFSQIMDTVTDFVAAGSFADMAENVIYESLPDYAQLVRTTDLKSNFSNNNFVYVNKKAFDFLWRVNLDTESIIMPNIGNCGEIYYVNKEILPYKHNVLGPNAILVRSQNQNNKFLSVSFLSDDFQKKIKLIVSPNGQTKFNKTELKTLDVIIPSVNEQIKVGTLFDSLDSLITLHQRKLEGLEEIKKGYMQRLFA